MLSKWPDDQSDDRTLPSKYHLFLSVCYLEPESFGLLQKILQCVCQYCKLRVQWSNLRNFPKFHEINLKLLSFEVFSFLSNFVTKTSGRFTKVISTWPGDQIFRKKFCFGFFKSWKKSSEHLRIVSKMDVKTAIHLSAGMNKRKKIFETILGF